jgi:hypothetical protein
LTSPSSSLLAAWWQFDDIVVLEKRLEERIVAIINWSLPGPEDKPRAAAAFAT